MASVDVLRPHHSCCLVACFRVSLLLIRSAGTVNTYYRRDCARFGLLWGGSPARPLPIFPDGAQSGCVSGSPLNRSWASLGRGCAPGRRCSARLRGRFGALRSNFGAPSWGTAEVRRQGGGALVRRVTSRIAVGDRGRRNLVFCCGARSRSAAYDCYRQSLGFCYRAWLRIAVGDRVRRSLVLREVEVLRTAGGGRRQQSWCFAISLTVKGNRLSFLSAFVLC